MADRGHILTETILADIEDRCKEEYEIAAREMRKKYRDYMAAFEEGRKQQYDLWQAGKISKQEYTNWVYRHTMVGKRWQQMADTLAADLEHTNEMALALARGKMPDVFALNANYGTYEIEHDGKIDTGFTLYNHDTAAYLMEDRQLMPGPSSAKAAEIAADKALQWNKRKIQSAVLQGVLQGESPYQIADRLRSVAEMNYHASVRYARTMTTSAQNAGRYESFHRADKLGVDLTLEWQATLDGRTRHSHRLLHGMRTTVDKPFVVDGVKIMYPAQSSGAGASDIPQSLIWNCRCTILAWVKGFEGDTVKSSPKMGKMTFEEWQHAKEPKNKPKKEETKRPNDVLKEKGITVDLSKAGRFAEKSEEALEHLVKLIDEYKNTVVGFSVAPGGSNEEGGRAFMHNGKTFLEVVPRAFRTNKATDELRLGKNQPFGMLYHEFAHGLTQSRQASEFDKKFWQEIKKVKREYSKQRYGQDWFSKTKISSYADKDIDEFMAEAFTQANLSESPSPFAEEVLRIIRKYYGKK